MSPTNPWQQFFTPPADGSATASVPMRLLRRNGNPFLLLPPDARLAVRSLALYAAQTQAARSAKALLRFGLRLGFSAVLEKTALNIAPGDAFANYLVQVVGQASRPALRERLALGPFATLAGNPNTAAQRCIFLLFDSRRQPVAVVKAGAGEAAGRLIEQEQTFLKTVPAGTRAVPVLHSVFHSERLKAFATNFFPGDSPRSIDASRLEELFSSWLHPARTTTIGELSSWQKLLAAAGEHLPSQVKQLNSRTISPAISHGDFAPWNIKECCSHWTLLDWERGELEGLPVWDWLHFVVQPAILVQHAFPDAILKKLEDLFASTPFARYAARANVQNLERCLAVAYFHHCTHVLRQTEGLQTMEALADIASAKWLVL